MVESQAFQVAVPLLETETKTCTFSKAQLYTTVSLTSDRRDTDLLGDSFCICNHLPAEPQEASTFTEAISITQSSKESQLNALSDSLYVKEIMEFADPSGPFAFNVTSSHSNICWEVVRRNLLLTGALGNAAPAVSLRIFTQFKVLPTANGVRVSIAASWWSGATAFTLVDLYHAGQVVPMPTLPATIAVVRVNHAPSSSSHGRLWKAARDGDMAEVVAAIKGGCSTEETDDKVHCILSTHHWQFPHGAQFVLCSFC